MSTITSTRPDFDLYYYEFGPYATQAPQAMTPPRLTSRPVPQPVERVAPQPPVRPSAPTPVDGLSQARFWTGTAITAIIGALVGLIGLVLSHNILKLALPIGGGETFSHVVLTYGMAAAGIALIAGALYAAMIHVAPRPTTYFAAVLTAVTALVALVPFTTTAPLSAQLALAIVNVVVGLIIAIFIPLAASNA